MTDVDRDRRLLLPPRGQAGADFGKEPAPKRRDGLHRPAPGGRARAPLSAELALFRSAHWPYYGYPQGFVARLAGEYRYLEAVRDVFAPRPERPHACRLQIVG